MVQKIPSLNKLVHELSRLPGVGPKSAQRQLVQPTETQLCATCHRLQVSKTERAVAHMPVREGKTGADLPRLLDSAVEHVLAAKHVDLCAR